jgi:hypothetical protein
MLRCALRVGFLAILTVCAFRALHADDKKADDKKAWQEAELKKLAGRWTTVREEKTDPDQKTRRRRIDLEFVDGELRVLLFDEKGAQEGDGSLKVIGVEQVGERVGPPFRLNLDKAEVYYDLVGEKLVVVGRVQPRPWEGFPLSGEYKRGAKPK